MKGWMQCLERMLSSMVIDPTGDGSEAIAAAAAAGFGYVLIHPTIDGNGRTHRLLIHWILNRLQYIPTSSSSSPSLKYDAAVFPISVLMQKDMPGYLDALSSFGYHKDIVSAVFDGDRMIVLNDTKEMFSHFDATGMTEYLCKTIEHSVNVEFANHLQYCSLFHSTLDEMKQVGVIKKHTASEEQEDAALRDFIHLSYHRIRHGDGNHFIDEKDKARHEVLCKLSDEDVSMLESKMKQLQAFQDITDH